MPEIRDEAEVFGEPNAADVDSVAFTKSCCSTSLCAAITLVHIAVALTSAEQLKTSVKNRLFVQTGGLKG